MHFILYIFEITYKIPVAHSVFSKFTLFRESILLGLSTLNRKSVGTLFNTGELLWQDEDN